MTHWCNHWNLSLKLYWPLSWQLSNTCLCNMTTSTVFTMKSCWLLCGQWSNASTSPCNGTILTLIFAWMCSTLVFVSQLHQEFLPWSCASICPCIEAILTLAFTMKLHPYLSLHRSRVTTYLLHEATPTLAFALKHHHYSSLPWSHVNTSFTLKPRQLSSLPWSHINTLFALKPCQYSFLPWHRVNTSSALKSHQHWPL